MSRPRRLQDFRLTRVARNTFHEFVLFADFVAYAYEDLKFGTHCSQSRQKIIAMG
jgi:hypothetical protein